jgi:peptidoglycan/xylan/chitin deacetylase (PgdA/CDA1 family)
VLPRPPAVLTYHALGTQLPRDQDPANLIISPEVFRSQMVSLKRRGYAFKRLTDFASALNGGPPPKGVCTITFDDGTLDNLTILEPLLAELEIPVTVFACPGLLGQPHHAIAPEANIRLMDEDELRQLDRSRWVEIGSHTSRHTELVNADAELALREMTESREQLESLLDHPVLSFAYPNCTYSASCPDAAARAGYEVAVTCGQRGGWTRYELRRQLIDGLDSRITFEVKARGIWRRVYDSPPGRLGRWAVRSRRHPDSAR